jgi:hypothetical protein
MAKLKTHCQDSTGTDACPQTSRSRKNAQKVIRMRFLGVQVAISNAEMKVMRSHLVGKTPEEALMLANKESNQKFWNPNTNCPAYFTANFGQWSSYQCWSLFIRNPSNTSFTFARCASVNCVKGRATKSPHSERTEQAHFVTTNQGPTV